MKKWIKVLIIFILLISLIFIYGMFIETNMLVTREYKVSEKNILNSFDGLKIVHISDIHYGRNITKKKLVKIVKEINLINPDIVVFTGDLVEYPNELKEKDLNILQEQLSLINAKINKYAILGNHDYEYSEEKVTLLLENSNFIVLKNSDDIIYNNSNEHIVIYGIDDVLKNKSDIDKTFSKNYENLYKIVLVHEPDATDEILKKDNTINLILSGHSHNGQVYIPFLNSLYNQKGAEKYYEFHYKINDTNLYISSGLGVSKVTFRLFNPPSINFYRINKEDN